MVAMVHVDALEYSSTAIPWYYLLTHTGTYTGSYLGTGTSLHRCGHVRVLASTLYVLVLVHVYQSGTRTYRIAIAIYMHVLEYTCSTRVLLEC